MEQEDLRRLLIKAGAYTAKAERSPLEVERKLGTWSAGEITKEEAEEILQALRADKFVDEQRYVEKYLSEKMTLLQKGPRLLRQELRAKGIPNSHIDKGIKEIPYRLWIKGLEKYLTARLTRQKDKAKNSYDLRHRLYQLGYGRGYESDMIEDVLEELDLTLENGAEEEYYY